jgi:glycosyltransferase involved in cell wall biosynthesis
MKICFVCNEYPPSRHGGIGAFVQILGRALVRSGHFVRVIGIHDRPDLPETRESDQGVDVRRLRSSSGRIAWLRARYELYQQISRWAKSREIDLVEVPDYVGFAAGWPRLPIPVIARLHGSSTYFASEMGWRVDPAMRIAEQWSLHRANFCCSCSKYTAKRSISILAPRLRVDAVLHNGIESVDADSTLVKSRCQVVFSGTLTPKKGIASLVDAWPAVQIACPEAQLHICGSDGRMSNGQATSAYIVAKLGSLLGKTVHYHGFLPRERVLDMLRTAPVAVFPSFSEAFALAPIEAMARGCATIFTKLSSGPELIEDGQTGLLVDPHQPQEISDALIRVLRDDQLAARLGAQARKHVDAELCINAIVTKNISFYESCNARFRPEKTMRQATIPSHVFNTNRIS